MVRKVLGTGYKGSSVSLDVASDHDALGQYLVELMGDGSL
jgi:hypothetical protein